jgi:hypothetical protein
MGFLDRNKEEEWRHGVYLCDAHTSLEADIIESKLRAEGIPCVKNYRGASNFMEIALGANTTQEIQIYVPAEVLEQAKKAIVSIPIEDDYEEGE